MEGEDGDLMPSLHTPAQIQKFAELVAIEVAECIALLSQFDRTKPFGDGYELALVDAADTARECVGLEIAE